MGLPGEDVGSEADDEGSDEGADFAGGSLSPLLLLLQTALTHTEREGGQEHHDLITEPSWELSHTCLTAVKNSLN